VKRNVDHRMQIASDIVNSDVRLKRTVKKNIILESLFDIVSLLVKRNKRKKTVFLSLSR
jgi:hypothetical protein